MMDMDEWERDPSVQSMRKVFKAMEQSLEKIREKLCISPYDHRIRPWLEKTLEQFERSWTAANRLGIALDEKTASALYAACLVEVIGSEGIQIPEGVLAEHKEAERLIREVLK
jgi:hypothetical protein